MKRTNIYTCPSGGFRIPHNKHLGNKNKWVVIKRKSNHYDTRK